jgi:hypothetical protein
MSLMLHAGAQAIDYDGLRALPTPEPTATHYPLPHHDLVRMVAYSLEFHGHTVEKQEFGVTPDGMRFFAFLTLKSDYGEYTDFLGLANSHDKSLPVKVGLGSSTFVCDNLAFVSDTVVARKHSANSKRMLPGLIAEMIEPLRDRRIAQHNAFERYKGTELDDGQADQLIMQMFRRGIINCTRIPEVLEQWENPTCDYGPKSVYRLFNGATWSLKPKVVEQPRLTQDLHALMGEVIDAEFVVVDQPALAAAE